MQLRLTLHEISEDELSEFSNVLSVGLVSGEHRRIDREDAMPGRRWIILAVLFAARAATGFQFQSIGSAANLLMQDLGISYSEIGMLLGAYLLPGIIVAFPAGLLGQRVREKTLGLAGLVLMAISGLVLSFSDGFVAALAARTIGGVGATSSSWSRPRWWWTGSTAARSCWRCRCCR